jgi:hypothetical protein
MNKKELSKFMSFTKEGKEKIPLFVSEINGSRR